MRNKNGRAIRRMVFLILLMKVLASTADAQTLTLQGNTCVTSGVQYQYYTYSNVSGQNVQWCITGSGKITGSTSTCVNGVGLSQIYVTWTGSGTVGAHYGSVGGSLSVAVSSTLVPGSITANASQSVYEAIPATISCSAASGGGCTNITFSYQWQQSANQTTWTSVSGATAQNLSFSAQLTGTTYYRRMVTNNFGSTGYSNTATVIVIPPLSGGTIGPGPQNIFAGTAPTTLSETSQGSLGGNCGGAYTYQWLTSTDGTHYGPVGTNSSSYSPPVLTQTTYYELSVGCGGQNATSPPVTVNVCSHLAPGTITSSMSFYQSGNPGTISTTAATGGLCNNTISYVLQQSTDGVTWTTIGSALSYTPGTLTTTTLYRWTITCGPETVYTSICTVAVYGTLTAGAITPAPETVNYNAVPPLLANPSGGDGLYTYQWYSSTDNVHFSPVPGAVGRTYSSATGLITMTWFYVVITDNMNLTAGPDDISVTAATVVVNVLPPLYPGTISPTDINISAGGNPGTITGNPAWGGDGSSGYTYLWQVSTDDGQTWNTATAPNSTLNYTPGTINATTWFRRQVTCGTTPQTAWTNTCQINVGTPPSGLNYIKTRLITESGATTTSASDALTSIGDVKQSTIYYDGLGRPAQTVMRQGSLATGGLPADLVIPNQYDAVGNEPFKYLPYVASTTDGSHQTNALQSQSAFNVVQFPGETYNYDQTNYEVSPLDRVNGTDAAGLNWLGSNRGVQQLLATNTATDAVQEWYVTNSGTVGVFGSYSTPGVYAPGTLFKSIRTDENGSQYIEFKDLDGKVILKKVEVSATADNGLGSGYTGWQCTYYIYDDLNNLRCVVQPHGVELLLQNNWNITALSNVILNQQCFLYEYDNRNRMIMKQLPGVGPIYMVYDYLDRLVMTQDANLRTAGKWTVILYENTLDRPVETGVWTNSITLATATASASVSTSYPFPPSAIPTSGWETLTIKHYDDYTNLPSGLSASLLSTGSAGSSTFSNSYSSFPYPMPLTPSSATMGLVTWTETEVMGSGSPAQFLSSATIFDERARAIQEQSINITSALDVITTQYSFSGQVLNSIEQHNYTSTSNPQSYTVGTVNTYDLENRLLTVTKSLSGTVNGTPVANPVQSQVIINNSYDLMGRLTAKALGTDPSNAPAPIETLTYDYNIRGWLLGINRSSYLSGSGGTNYFGLELAYDKTTSLANGASYAIAQYNGNIAGTIWKSRGDGIGRIYDFNYDNANRLMQANYHQNTMGTNWTDNVTMNYSMNISSYDANGNIQGMSEQGFELGSPVATIDALSYSYLPNSNQLNYVTNTNSNPNTVLGDFHDGTNAAGTADYAYDLNGNPTMDNNKSINNITYNYFNQPQTISVTGKGTITYTYDGLGHKLQKLTTDNTGSNSTNTLTTTITYIGPFVYQSQVHNTTLPTDTKDVLQFVGHEEGRIRPITPSTYNTNKYFAYDYFIKDHLNNTRVVLTDELEQDITIPAATFEDGAQGTLTQYYTVNNTGNITANSNIPGGYSTNISSYPNNNGISNPDTDPNVNVTNSSSSGYMYMIQHNAVQQADVGILLKVTSGDVISIFGKTYYFSNSTSSSNNNLITSALNNFVSGFMGTGSVVNHFGDQATTTAATQMATSGNTLNTELAGTLTAMPTPPPSGLTPPKAGINWILFDNQLNAVASNSGSYPASNVSSGTLGQCTQSVPISKSGYLYVYCSNESSNIDVYFDNIQVVNTRGRLLEETHYYPFGLTMAGISDKALKMPYAENKYRANGGDELQNNEFADGSGLELYDAVHRMFDPQLGRFGQPDPLAFFSRSSSPYVFANNSPVGLTDPFGLLSTYDNPEELATATVIGHKANMNDNSFFGLFDMAKKAIKQIVEQSDFLKSELFPLATQMPLNPPNTLPSVDQLSKKEGELDQQLLELSLLPYIGEEEAVVEVVVLKEAEEEGAETLIEAEVAAAESEQEATNLPATTLHISDHALKMMEERGITRGMVKTALLKGEKYWDPKNKVFNYVLKNAFASGKSLLVGRYPLSGVVSTAERISRLNVLQRMIKL